MFFLKFLFLLFQDIGMFLDPVDSGESSFNIHLFGSGSLGFIELFVETVNDR